MIDIRQRLLVVFEAEAKEHLARIRSILGTEGAGTPGAGLDEMFRRAHSLKGAARAVDLRIVESLAHPLETLFVRVREGKLRLDPRVVAVVHQALDGIEDGVAAQISGKAQAEPAQLLQAINALADGGKVEDVKEDPKVSAPEVPAPVKESIQIPAPQLSGAVETVRVNASIIERLHQSAGELTTQCLGQNQLTNKVNGVGRQVAELAHEWGLVRKSSASVLRRMDETPELARLGRYLNFAERQVSALTKEMRDLALFQQRSAWSLKNLSGQLQQDVCGARMILAETVFGHFGKMMRDLARDEGRQIEFKTAGLEVQADRLVLQALKDPLMHLLRNTLAHGIESPEERKRTGKLEVGAIGLKLETQGTRLIVTVEDDGRGVDLGRVTEVAVSKHIVNAAAASAMPPEERMRLIFHPGLSTTRGVTELSGRGMGLSVVAEAVGHLQGSVDVARGAVCGTRFTVSVPLALTTSRLVMVKCREQRFALLSHELERLERIKIKDVATIEGRLTINFRETLIPMASLARVMDFHDDGVLVERETVPVAVLKSGEKRAAIAVDAFLSEFEGVIKDLNPLVMKAGKLSGGVVMGDGSIVLVLNAAELIECVLKMEHVQALKTAVPAVEKREPTILLVDDSMTTRTLEKSILEAHGYKVLVAVDGVEGLNQLRAAKIDLVISDVEMPRMDGFGLLEEIKKDPALSKIPLILVTSLEKREDRERGLALGADGYLVKRKFDQKILLETVAQII